MKQRVSKKFVARGKVSRDCRTRGRRSTVDESNQNGVSEFSPTPCMKSELEISALKDHTLCYTSNQNASDFHSGE